MKMTWRDRLHKLALWCSLENCPLQDKCAVSISGTWHFEDVAVVVPHAVFELDEASATEVYCLQEEASAVGGLSDRTTEHFGPSFGCPAGFPQIVLSWTRTGATKGAALDPGAQWERSV